MNVFLVATTVLALVYARHAYRQSLRTSALRLSLFDPIKKRPISFSTDPGNPTTIIVSKAAYEAAVAAGPSSGGAVGLQIDLVIRNVGTRTAKNVRVHIRYSSLFKEVRSMGTRLANSDDRETMVIEHQIADIHPKQERVQSGDLLVPSRILFDGVSDETELGESGVRVRWQVTVSARIEFIVYSEDAEPIFQQCSVAAKGVDSESTAAILTATAS